MNSEVLEKYDIEIDKALKIAIGEIEQLTEDDKSDTKNFVGYESKIDFWIGYAIGYLEGHVINELEKNMDRPATKREKLEVRELVKVRYSELRDVVSKQFVMD